MYKDSFYMVGNSEHKFASQTLGTRKYPLLIFDAYIRIYFQLNFIIILSLFSLFTVFMFI
jgi:hypothetical protein